MAEIQYDPACVDCRRDNGRDLASTTWQCSRHVLAERNWLRAKLANVMVESERADRSAAAWKRTADQLESEVASLRSDTYALRTENGALRNERNAALTLAEQRGAAYDMTWREVESLREWKDKLEAEVDEITALVDKWRSGRAHLGTPATFVDQRLLDGILNVGVSVSGQRGGTVTFSHWSGAATKPDEEHGAKCECCKGDGYYGVADGDGDVDTIICESLVSQRDSWHKEAEAWKQTAANLQARADRFEFLRELLVAVVKTGTKDPLLDARLAEELRSHE